MAKSPNDYSPNRSEQLQIDENPDSSNGKLITFLLGICFVLTTLSGCLIAALVLVARTYVHDVPSNFTVERTESHSSGGMKFDHKLKSENLTMEMYPGAWTGQEPRLWRLQEGVKPVHYDITLKPNLEKGILNGKVNVTIQVEVPSMYVILNAHMLEIVDVFVKTGDGNSTVPLRDVAPDNRLQTLVIYFDHVIEPAVYFIVIEYAGNMKNTMVGMYLSYYTTKNNEKRAIATSKFEPTHARRAFPCFDEPQLKATFTAHILKPDDPKYIALSNMPEERSEKVSEGVMVHFQESVKMSTYLFCFIVCDFDHTAEVIHASTDIPFRVFASPDQKPKTEFATKIGKSIIEYFNRYFGVDFPLPKLDMIAIPDFVSGAMEHWGLVTFRETSLLYHPNVSTTMDKQQVASVVAHEFVHSWFGNLVTMDWWNDLWLSEGFATYIFFKGVDEVLREEWRMMDQFLIERMHAVMKLDATVSTHPILQNVQTPDEITSIFDTISYNKGGTVLRMLEDAVTEEVFKTGVRSYLNTHAYGNAVTDDFWNALGLFVQDVDVTTFMKTWTMQSGYPIVNVRSKNDTYLLTQERFLTDPDATDMREAPYNYKWIIPVTYITNETSTSVLVWFQHDDHEIEIAKPMDVKWVKFNYRQIGMYRVNYEEEHWKNIVDNILEMETADRTHLIEETFALAESGYITYDTPLNLSRYMVEERDYVPWSAFNYAILDLIESMQNSDEFRTFEKYVQKLVRPAFEHYNWIESPTDTHLNKRARVIVISLACEVNLKECVNTATAMFVNWLEGKLESIPRDFSGVIYKTGMKYAPVEYWDLLFERFTAEKDAGEKIRLMQGLTAVKDHVYLNKLLKLTESDRYIRSQDYFTCLSLMAQNQAGRPIVWDYVRDNWMTLVARFSLNDRGLGRLVPAITRNFGSETKLDEMHNFFMKYPEAGAGQASRHLALEQVKNNIKWLRRYKGSVEAWIQANEQL